MYRKQNKRPLHSACSGRCVSLFLCGAVREVDNSDLSDSLFDHLKNTLDFFNRVSRQNNFTTLFTFHAGNIFDNDYTIFQLYCVNGRAGFHFALAEKAGHSYSPFVLRSV